MGDKEYRPWDARQSLLLPPLPLEWLPEGHLAYFILGLVAELDFGEIERSIQSKDSRGTRPYSPGMMTALLVYPDCVGVDSSRKIERASCEDVAFRVSAGGQHPHLTRINAFRKTHPDALSGLFVQVLQLCHRAGLVKRGHVAMDGTKVQAAASKHPIIVAQAVASQSPDNGNLLPLLDQIRENCDTSPKVSTADAGYWFPEVESEGLR